MAMAAHRSSVLNMANTRMTVKPRAVFNKDYNQLRVPYELKQGQTRLFHKLPSGLNMEVIFQKGMPTTHKDPTEKTQNPPLVFVHGSFHAAWCWAEHWLPFFSQHGFDCYALSLLGQVVFGGGHAATIAICAAKKGLVKPTAITAVAPTWVSHLPIMFGRDSNIESRYGLLRGDSKSSCCRLDIMCLSVMRKADCTGKTERHRLYVCCFLHLVKSQEEFLVRG